MERLAFRVPGFGFKKSWMYFLFLIFGVLVEEAFALGGGQPGPGGEQSSMMLQMMPFVLMFVVMYFLIIRPQHKKQKDHQTMIDSIQKGDRVVTSGGVHGTVTRIKEKDAILVMQVAKDVQIEVSRGSVSRVVETKGKKK
ncbi:MAG: preprotein translocase subunit YajC [bacterium]|nr:preprotein translocase subunit YajC [bacterium]